MHGHSCLTGCIMTKNWSRIYEDIEPVIYSQALGIAFAKLSILENIFIAYSTNRIITFCT